MEFKDILKKYRLESGMTKAEFGKKLGINSYSTYNNYEVGSSEPKINMLVKIANVLNVSLDDLLGRTQNDKPKIKMMIDTFLKDYDENNIETSILDDNHILLSIPVNEKINYSISINIKNFDDKFSKINKIILQQKEQLKKKTLKDILIENIKENKPIKLDDKNIFIINNTKLTLEELKKKYPKKYEEYNQNTQDCLKKYQTLLTKFTANSNNK